MNFWKRLGLFLAASFFSVFLLAAVWSSVAALTIGNRGAVKRWFRVSKAYDDVVDIVLESVKTSDTSEQNGTVPVDRPEIHTIARNAFSPVLLQTNTEKFLDASYDWLQGKTPKPVFKLDFTAAKQQLATGVGNYVKQRLSGLPACTGIQDLSTYDVFSATCLPKGVDPAKAGADVTKSLSADQSFLANPVITADSLKTSQNLFGQSGAAETTQISVFDQAQVKRLPHYYHLIHMLPYLFGVLILLCAVAIVFTSPDRRSGFGRVGFSLLWTGGLLVLSVLIFGLASGKIKATLGVGQTVAFQNLINGMVDAIFSDIDNVLLWFGILSLVGGVAAMGGLWFVNRRSGGRNEYGQRLAPKESPKSVRERYKRELAEFIKQQKIQEQRAAHVSQSEVRERFKQELDDFTKQQSAEERKALAKAAQKADGAKPEAKEKPARGKRRGKKAR